jgi:hypothetical protein
MHYDMSTLLRVGGWTAIQALRKETLTTLRKQASKAQRKGMMFRGANLEWAEALLTRWEEYIRKAQAAHRVETIISLQPSSALYSDDAPPWRQANGKRR